MKTKSNYQDILKIIALIAMIIDHVELFALPGYLWMRMIGRFALPIFAFYAGYNFKGNVRHMVWICGLLVVLAWKFVYGAIYPNILIDLAIGQLYLSYAGRSIMKDEKIFLAHFLLMIGLTPLTIYVLDYGTITIAFMMIGFMIANGVEDKNHVILASLALMLFNLIRFDIDEIPYLIGMIFFVSIACYLIKNISHKAQLPFNVNIISRNMLYVYTFSTGFLIFFGSLY